MLPAALAYETLVLLPVARGPGRDAGNSHGWVINSWNNNIGLRIPPCGVGSLSTFFSPNGGTALLWRVGGPIANREWDQRFCVGVGGGNLLWWDACDGSPAQQWAAYYPPVPFSSSASYGFPPPPPFPAPPPFPPSPPPPPPTQALLPLPSSPPSPNATAVASLADLRAAAANSSVTEFLIVAPFIALDGSPVAISRPGARVRVAGAAPGCQLWSGACPRISARNLSSILTVSASTFELSGLELSDGRGTSASGGVTVSATTSVLIQNVGFRGFETQNVRSLLPLTTV